MPDLRLTDVTKRYGPTLAVDGLSLHVADRELVTLLGPSGSGKTTALRAVAGFVELDGGTIAVGGREIQHLAPEQRDIGMVFQNYALFPHLTVERNIAFGLERRRVPKHERARRIAEMVDLVQLGGLEHRLPRQLSGGQQQRVALARALAIRPSLLLLDEPLSNLDAKLRGVVRLEIRRLQRELGITTILVTHDQEEALTISDRVAVLRDGRLQQLAPPEELYARPANRFVADFIGHMSFLDSVRLESHAGGLASYTLTNGTTVLAPDGDLHAIIAIRPEVVQLGQPPDGITANRLTGTLAQRQFLGEVVHIAVAAGGVTLAARLPGGTPLPADGSDVTLWWRPDQSLAIPTEG
ncbi:MAG: ABC transporter ATP-binding protein [Chloroflexota bacterium]